MEEWPILFPHDIISYLFHGGMDFPSESIREYWEHNCRYGEPWAQDSSMHRMIPLGLFGDGVTIKKEFGSQSVVGVVINVVLWRPQSTRFSRFCVFAFPVDKEWKHHTLRVAMRHITWSLNACFEGKFPYLDAYDDPLPPRLAALAGQSLTPQNYRFIVTELRGDWAYHKKLWRFHRTSWNGINMCHQCAATAKGDVRDLYWNFTTGRWHNAEFSTDDFMTRRIPPTSVCFLHYL